MPIQKQSAPAKASGVSLNPETFAEGGGLLDDAEVMVADAAFVLWDYQGKAQQVPALAISFKDSEEKEHDQYYSAGDKRYFVPSEGGESLIPVGDKTSIQATCNAAQFLKSLVNAGFPTDKLEDGDIGILKGMKCHVHREAQMKRVGLAAQAREDGTVREKTILLVDKIIQLPWESAKGSGKAASKPNGAEAGEATDASEQLTALILGKLAEGPITKAKLPSVISTEVEKSDPNRAQMIKLAFNDAFLKDGPWEYKGGRLSLE